MKGERKKEVREEEGELTETERQKENRRKQRER